MHTQYNCDIENVVCAQLNREDQAIRNDEREALIQNIRKFRRAIWHDTILSTLHTFGDHDFSLTQLATMLLLEEEKEPTIKHVAEILKRSVSATSRLIDQLVERGWVARREDMHDRRSKRISITEQGREVFAAVERRRAEAQLTVMEHLSDEEQAIVAKAMSLLAQAGTRRYSDEYSGTRAAGVTGE